MVNIIPLQLRDGKDSGELRTCDEATERMAYSEELASTDNLTRTTNNTYKRKPTIHKSGPNAQQNTLPTDVFGGGGSGWRIWVAKPRNTPVEKTLAYRGPKPISAEVHDVGYTSSYSTRTFVYVVKICLFLIKKIIMWIIVGNYDLQNNHTIIKSHGKALCTVKYTMLSKQINIKNSKSNV